MIPLRADRAGAVLRAVPETSASTTFAAAAGRFDDTAVTAVEKAMGTLVARWFKLVPARHRELLVATRPTIDFDGTDIEVYGSKKQKVAWNYAGQPGGRIRHLGRGRGGVGRRPGPAPVRCDAGYFDAKVAYGPSRPVAWSAA